MNENPDAPDMRADRAASIEQLLLATVRAEPESQIRLRRRRGVIWGAIGLLVIGGAATASAIVLNSSPVSNVELVHCLNAAQRNADGSYPGSAGTIAQSDGVGRVDDARDLCGQMWAQGILNKSYDPTATTNAPGRVPAHLTVCVMADGSAAVVPSGAAGICSALGLAPLKN